MNIKASCSFHGSFISKIVNHKSQKQETAPNGLRTDLSMPIDRPNDESLLSGIPLSQYMPCILHGLARIVEKLISLEVELVMSQAAKNAAVQANDCLSVDDLVKNFESNVNARGVRGSHFYLPLINKVSWKQLVSTKIMLGSWLAPLLMEQK